MTEIEALDNEINKLEDELHRVLEEDKVYIRAHIRHLKQKLERIAREILE